VHVLKGYQPAEQLEHCLAYSTPEYVPVQNMFCGQFARIELLNAEQLRVKNLPTDTKLQFNAGRKPAKQYF
jgi:hypothetical protein